MREGEQSATRDPKSQITRTAVAHLARKGGPKSCRLLQIGRRESGHRGGPGDDTKRTNRDLHVTVSREAEFGKKQKQNRREKVKRR